MFSQYSSPRFEVEPVEVVTADSKSTRYPDLSLRSFEVDVSYINRTIGTSLSSKEVSKQYHGNMKCSVLLSVGDYFAQVVEFMLD